MKNKLLFYLKHILIASLFLSVTKVNGQKKLFDTLKIEAGTKIVGRYEHFDQDKTYEKYNFIIDDPEKIKQFVKELKLGEEVPNSLENPAFKLTVLKNHREIGVWTVNPSLKSVMVHDGHTYAFDLAQISQLNQLYPFAYNFEVKTFTAKSDFETYLAAQKKKVDFLFYYAPQFKYEGSFEIEFKASPQFTSPKAITDFLSPYLQKLVKANEYRMGYVLNEKNINNKGQYTMTITGPKRLFDQLQVDGLKNENWQPMQEKAHFFYRIKP